MAMVVRKRSMQILLPEKAAHRLRGCQKKGLQKVAFELECWTGSGCMRFSVSISGLSPLSDQGDMQCVHTLSWKKGGTAFIRPLLEQFRWRAFCLMASQRILCAEVKVYVLNTLYLSIKISTAQLEIFLRHRAFHRTREFLLCKETRRFSKHSWRKQGNAAFFSL